MWGTRQGRGHDRHGTGSSPRMWGTLVGLVAVAPVLRFIPTHVGTRRPRPMAEGFGHPHACGEHGARGTVGLRFYSNPTHCGERGCCKGYRSVTHGFIPTHVGNAISPRIHLLRCRSLPRMWGTPRCGYKCWFGSSPRIASEHGNANHGQIIPQQQVVPTHVGNVRLFFYGPVANRLIPTHVGTHYSRSRAKFITVHATAYAII